MDYEIPVMDIEFARCYFVMSVPVRKLLLISG